MSATPQDELFTSTEGYFITKTLLALWRLGILDRAVAGKIHPARYAAEHGCDPDLLQAALGYLVVRDYFEADDGFFQLSERGRRIAPYFGYLPMHVGAYEPVLCALEDLIRGQRVYGRDLKRTEAEMLGGMTALEEHILGRLADMTGDSGFSKVLDLGCGSARLLAKLLQRNPGARGVGIDWEPAAVDDGQRTLADAGLTGRATVLRGDAGRIRELPADMLDGVDLVISMFVLHEIYRQRSRLGVIECLEDIADTLGAPGRLLMVEVSRIEPVKPRANLRFIPEYQLIHEFSNQRLASKDEWRDMLAEAGMTVLRTEPAGMCEAFCFIAARARPDDEGGRPQ
jgi:2-ketoarginine methyltransferase